MKIFAVRPFSENIDAVRSGYVFGGTGTWAIWDWGATYGAVKQATAILRQSQITYDDAVRQVELEVQQADSNVKQSAELVKATEESVGQAEEALRLASARLSAGAGTQLEVLNSRVEVTQAQSNRLQALFNYNTALAGIGSCHRNRSHLFQRARRTEDAKQVEDRRSPHAGAEARSA